MTILFRWIFRLAVLLIVLSLAAFTLGYYLAAQSLPEYEKEIELPGLKAELEIIRDTYNVPHLFGKNDHDIFFGLGYAHAQDRLWQMTVLRRTAQGRLAEVFGIARFNNDQFYRRLDLYGAARKSFDHFSDDAKILVEAYAKGVNARITEVNRSALGRGAPEMFLFNAPFSVWTPIDSIAILKMFGVQWSEHLATEILYARLLLTLKDATRVSDLMPDVPGTGNLSIMKKTNIGEGQKNLSGYAKIFENQYFDALSEVGFAGASNAFAAGKSRTFGGGPLLANDPHVPLTAPSLWYLARLELQSGGVIGASIPGLPLLLSGRSDKLGWAVTSSYIDDQDVFVEQIHPSRHDFYKAIDGYKKFENRPSIIRILNQKPVTIMLRWSDNGPILSPQQYNIHEITPTKHVMALSSTALRTDDRSLESFLSIMSNHTVENVELLMADFQTPSLTLTLVDANDISINAIGLRPARQKLHQTQGRWPSYGWEQKNRWNGFFLYDDRPGIRNPNNDIIVNTNNKLIEKNFPEHGSFLWGDSQRIHRLKSLLKERVIHTSDSFKEAQLDTVSYTARTLLPLVAANLLFTERSGKKGSQAQMRKNAMDLLAAWNGEMDEYRPEPLIYMAWMRALQDRLIRDEIGDLADQFIHLKPLFIERVFRNVEGAEAWCDVVHSQTLETCNQIASAALDDALNWLSETYSPSLTTLRWGEAHQALHRHSSLGTVSVFKYFVNIVQPTSGGDHTVQRGRVSGLEPTPFQNIHAAGYRGIYDFSDSNSSIFVIATGQSGHPLSKHYDDLGQLWRRGEYWRMSLDKELISSASIGTTRLKPNFNQKD